MSTYSFLNTNCSLTGPGGTINLGVGAAVTEEGITIEYNEPINKMDIAADGTPMHSLGANKSGTVTVRVQKTSPANQKLSAMYALQIASAKTHGKNTISLANSATQDAVTCQEVAFQRGTGLTYARDAGMNEWAFDAGIIDATLGGNA